MMASGQGPASASSRSTSSRSILYDHPSSPLNPSSSSASSSSSLLGAGIFNTRTVPIKVKLPPSWNTSAATSPVSPATLFSDIAALPIPYPSSPAPAVSITTTPTNSINSNNNNSSVPSLGRSQSPLSISSTSSTSSDRTFAATTSSRVSNASAGSKPPIKKVCIQKKSPLISWTWRLISFNQIMDLEIANESLLAVNASLETTIREQSRKMEQLNKRIAFLSRSVPEMVVKSMKNATAEHSGADRGFMFGDLEDPEERLMMLEVIFASVFAMGLDTSEGLIRI
ncbi:hypothetical protein BC829DRAFT_407098 [Chytridium lagenaria]|nr:hypothetical protein BC829DRAFT_407098 [Chytridium lagenaria]